ncbi:MAG: acylneuraminate cytidylyltransferase family protein [Deltaproteobacteria bacterium]|nr:MAG: acylneuraminate cytidylyltransferase family protein [Deltaproteobacteria bacterium]
MVKDSIVAVIPARGGSKRIEKKNIVSFLGKPMIAWTIEAAQQTGLFSRIIVSTDDQEIADVAQLYGATVPFLRKYYSDDISPVSLATMGTLNQLRDELNEEYEIVVQLMANCPLRNETHIRDAFNYFKTVGASSQISCFKFGWMNPWWAATLDKEGHPISLFPDAGKQRSQDLPPLYCPTGAVWISKVEHLMKYQTYHSPDRIFWPMAWQAAVDIDDYEDLQMAELLYQMQIKLP